MNDKNYINKKRKNEFNNHSKRREYYNNHNNNRKYYYSKNYNENISIYNNNKKNYNSNNNNNFNKYNLFQNRKIKFENNIKFISDSINNLTIMKKKKEIIETIMSNKIIIISGKTGCGKSTQVPKFIYEYYQNRNKKVKILMTQPRRIATISIANRIKEEYNNEKDIVGYQISMDKQYNEKHSIIIKTTGIFLEELVHYENNNNNFIYDYIIIDEVHERDINIDLCLTILKLKFKENKFKNCKLILMSATISENTFSEYFSNLNNNYNVNNDKIIPAPIIKIEEKIYDIETFYLEDIKMNLLNEDPLFESPNYYSFDILNPYLDESLFIYVYKIIEMIQIENINNNSGILIFLPGYNEIILLQNYLINKFIEFSENNKNNINNNIDFMSQIEIHILHSNISYIDQQKIFKKTEKRKLIISTNISESSITIPNIDYIIDFCLMKINKYNKISNTEKLTLIWCSKANCNQRSGRTGRIRKGYVFRLINKNFYYEKMQNFPIPEILRIPLEKCILKIKILNCGEPEYILQNSISIPLLDNIKHSIKNLQNLSCLTFSNKFSNSGFLTFIGKIYNELPIDIKLIKFIIICYCFGILEVGIIISSILNQEKSLFKFKKNIINDIYECKNYFNNLNNIYNDIDCYDDYFLNCDFLISYIIYMNWYKLYGHKYLQLFEYNNNNEKISYYDQQKINWNNFYNKNNKINKEDIEKENKFIKKNCLDKKVLKEVLRTSIDLKKRLNRLGMYNDNYDKIEIFDLSKQENILLFKYIIFGSFYMNIFKPYYINDYNIRKMNIMEKK